MSPERRATYLQVARGIEGSNPEEAKKLRESVGEGPAEPIARAGLDRSLPVADRDEDLTDDTVLSLFDRDQGSSAQ